MVHWLQKNDRLRSRPESNLQPGAKPRWASLCQSNHSWSVDVWAINKCQCYRHRDFVVIGYTSIIVWKINNSPCRRKGDSTYEGQSLRGNSDLGFKTSNTRSCPQWWVTMEIGLDPKGTGWVNKRQELYPWRGVTLGAHTSVRPTLGWALHRRSQCSTKMGQNGCKRWESRTSHLSSKSRAAAPSKGKIKSGPSQKVRIIRSNLLTWSTT